VRTFALLTTALLCATAARAGDNDLQLFRLGHPDDISVCTKCDGTDTKIEAGDLAAQARFARMTAALGLALVPSVFEPAATTGQAGFELGFSGKVAFLRLSPEEWPTAGTLAQSAPPTALFLPTISLRKGLGGSFEVGAAATMLSGSQIVAVTGEFRWALLEGIDVAPDLSLRIHATRALGTQELDLTAGGGDLTISKSFGVLGVLRVQPYAQYGVVMVNATTGVIDFHPQSENLRDPTSDDGIFRQINFFKNRYQRFVVGLRLVAGVAVVGLEGSYASGTNAIQNDDLSDGTRPPSQTTKMWTASGRLGLAF
jgi:hypothetical protein